MSVIRVCICLLAGALAPQLSSIPPGSDQIAVVLVLLLLCLPKLRRIDVACVLLGGVMFCLHVDRVASARLSPDYASDSMLAAVRIADFPQTKRATTSFVVTPVADTRLPPRLRLSWFEPPVELRLGDVWQLHVKLRRPRGNSNPGSADAEAWLTRQRIGATGYVVDGVLNELVDSRTTKGVERLREQILSRIDQRLGQHDSSAVIAAIIVGARHRLSDEQWDRYARTGTSHLMAISGLHVGLAAVGAFYTARLLLGLFGIVSNQQRLALALSLAVAIAYALVSGFAVPAQRAVVMLLTGGFALLLQRHSDGSRMLAGAAIAVLVIDPLTTMAPGYWLSFAAVGILYWLARRTTHHSADLWRKPIAATRKLAAVQCLLFVGLTPLTVLLFDRVSLSAPFVNLVAVPLFSTLTVPLALFSLLCAGPLEQLGAALLDRAAWSVGLVESLIAFVAPLPGGAHVIPELAGVAWLCLLLPMAWVALPVGWPVRHAAWLGVLVLLVWKPDPPPRGCTDVTVLDVGQGLAVVVRTGARTLLYDTGPVFRSGSSAAGHVVLPYLASIGVTRVDRMIVSHGDLDHAGGVTEIDAALTVGDLLTGEPLAVAATRRCHDGIAWLWGDTRFRFLHPGVAAHYGGNDASCLLLVETGTHKLLVTGDIEAAVEADLVRRRVLPRVDVVTIPHHGSRTSSIAPFVHALSPDYAIASAAHANQWGFPKPDVVARWRAAGTAVLNTATSGAIRIRQCEHGAAGPVERHRQATRRLWRDDVRNAEF